MLARKIMTKTYRYIDFVSKMFERLEFDINEIESFFDLTLKNVERLDMNLGDQHNGESTVIIEFENSNKIVYKPTNIGITSAYNQFLNWININLDEDLKTFRVIDKDTYGWLEFVEHLECDSINDVKCYYQRAGVLLGVAYFLNAKDVHFENIIAHGNSPVFIDHETIIGPILKKLYKGEEESKSNFSGTILETNLLPIKEINIPHYIYGFGSSIQLESNFTVLKLKNPNQDRMSIMPEEEIKKLYKSNKPLHNQKIENLIDYQLEFMIGFQKLYELILKNKVYLLSANSPVINFCNFKIRFINRPTKVYNKILNILNRPEYLSDSLKYGIKLELLARVYATSNNWSPILDFEREQMLLNDIPVFYINTLDNNVKLSNGESIDIIQLNAVESVYHKIKNACLGDFNNQIKLISDSIKL
jgi:type 2 lantibiotic biosynthesis protein LanM